MKELAGVKELARIKELISFRNSMSAEIPVFLRHVGEEV
jgi:hypothetical protein